ncbi:hypothetical protein B1810_14435 [Panacagrimonas perspica]|nr:hypothetical protein B1810_14435 [Panacagrimonas perspica]
MPEELAIALQARAARWNGLADKTRWTSEMRRALADDGQSCEGLPEIEAMAMFHGEPVGRFVVGHTVVPLIHAFSADDGAGEHGGPARRHLLPKNAFRVLRAGAYLCRKCVEEDLDFHGMSWWRRDHQLPGLFWCPKHRTALHLHQDAAVFRAPPSAVISEASCVGNEWCEELRSNALISRFIEIQEGLLSLEVPLSERVVSRMMRDRASDQGFHSGVHEVKRPLVSTLLREKVDPKWIDTLYGGFGETQDGYYFSIDGTLRGHHDSAGAVSYALVAAVLWSSADDALTAMMDADSTRGTQDRSAKPGPDRARLEAAYLENRGGHAAVARKLNLREDTVRQILDAAGFPALGAGMGLLKAAAAFYLDGESLNNASRMANVKASELEKLIRTSGQPFADILRRWVPVSAGDIPVSSLASPRRLMRKGGMPATSQGNEASNPESAAESGKPIAKTASKTHH